MGTTYLCLCSARFIPLGHTNRIDVYIGHKLSLHARDMCDPYVAIISNITMSATKHITPNGLKKAFF